MKTAFSLASFVAGALILTASAGFAQEKKISPELDKRIQHYLQILNSSDEKQKAMAARNLGRMGSPALLGLMNSLKSKSPTTRLWAAHGLGKLKGKAAPAIPYLIPGLSSKNRTMCVITSVALSEIGPKSILWLCRAMQSKSANTRYWAIKALEQMDEKAAPAIPNLVMALDDPRDMVQYAAVKALGKIGPDAWAAVPGLKKTLKEAVQSKDGYLKGRVEWALQEIQTPKTKVERVLDRLEEKPYYRKSLALKELVKMGPQASKAVPALLVLARKNKAMLKWRITETLVAIAPKHPEVLQLLAENLQDRNSLVFTYSLARLEKMGPAAAPVLPGLAKLYRNGSKYQRWELCRIFVKIGKPAIPIVARDLKHADYKKVTDAIYNLEKFGPPAIPWLKRVTNHSHPKVQSMSKYCINRIRRSQKVPVVTPERKP